METAYLKIKFIPFFTQSQHGDTKCSVEIVPDISCVQNFDKIEWKGGKNNIEYTIPITYKIILKKLHEDKNEVIKTYHSCLGLPFYSSLADISVGSGDVTRMISDTFILRKLASQVVRRDKPECIDSNLNKTTNTLIHMFDITHISANGNNDKVTKSLEAEHNLANKVFKDKMTDTSNIGSLDNKSRNINYQVVNFSNMRNRPFFYCKQNEVCGKGDDRLEFINSNTATGTSNNWSDKETKKGDNIFDSSNVYDDRRTYEKGTEICKQIKNFDREFCNNNIRISPQVRISRYKKMMEDEITPLKIKLNEILYKCKVLGLYKFNYASSSSIALMYKTIPTRESMVTETQEQEKSNRVVYSIFVHD